MTFATTLFRFKTLWAAIAMMAMSLALAPAVLAAPTGTPCDYDADPFGIDCVDQELQLGNQDIRQTIAQIINVALSLLGIVAVVIILIGGFKWMTAGGNEDQVAEARKMIFAGIIGLAIILSAFAIASFVLDSLQSATDYGGASSGPST